MRLPDIKFTTGVQSLGRENINAPLISAKRAAAVAGLVGSVAESVGDIAEDIYDRQVKMDVENAQAGFLSGNAELEKEHGQKIEYDSTELPEGMYTTPDYGPGGGPRKPVAAYEVQPELLRQQRTEMMEAQASSIRDKDESTNFRNNTTQLIQQQYIRDIKRANKQQIVTRRKNQGSMIDQQLNQGNYDAARLLAKDLEGTDEEKRIIQFGIDKTQETDTMDLAITQSDVIAMEALSRAMKVDPEDYEGTLTQAERMSWAGKLDRAIWQSQKNQRELAAENAKVINRTGQDVRDALYAGYELPPERVQHILNEVKETNPLLATDIVRASRYQVIAAQVATLSPSARKIWLESMRDKVEDEVQALDHARMEDAIAKMNREQANDSATYGYKHGITEQVDIDPQNLAGSLSLLNKNDNILRNQIGPTTGIFTQNQAIEIANTISQQTPDQLLITFATIEGALGDEANKVYEQLKAEGLTDTIAVAGQVAADGDVTSARWLVEGRRHRQNYPKMFTLIERDMDEAIDAEIGSMYKDKQGQHELMRSAIKDAYATRLGDDVRPESFDDDILDWAIQTATGGAIEANGYKIVAPIRGMPQEVWDDYVDGMKISTLKRMGKPLNMSYTQLNNDIDDEKIQFRSSGANEYYLFHTPSNEFIRDQNTGDVFIFKYLDAVEDELDPDPVKDAAIKAIEEDRKAFKKSKEKVVKDIKSALKKAGKTAGEIGDFLVTPLGELLEEKEGKLRPGSKIPEVILPKVKSRLRQRAGQIGDWLQKPIADFF